MSKLSTVLLTAGLILVLFVYVLLYTPLYEMLWGYQPPKGYQPQTELAKRPVLPKIEPKTSSTKEVVTTKEAVVAEKIKIEAPKKPAAPPPPPPKYVNLRDPFALDFAIVPMEAQPETPAAAPTKPRETLVLQGIFLSGNVKTSIIDDKIVSVGSGVAQGYKVYDIRTDSVILKKGGAYKTIQIRGGID